MKITQVSYRALRSGPGFNNQALEATSPVADDGPGADTVLAELRQWVNSRLEGTQELYKLRDERTELKAEIEHKRREIGQFFGLSEALMAWLKDPTEARAAELRAAGKPFLDDEILF